MGSSARGAQRERAVRDWLAKRDWLAFRAPASLGCADVIALRAGSRPWLVEVKSTAGGPYERFGPVARSRLRLAAEMAGADAFLAWWPPHGTLRWIPAAEWPRSSPVGLSDVCVETAAMAAAVIPTRPPTAAGGDHV